MRDNLAVQLPIACAPLAIPAEERSAHFTLGRELLARRRLSKQLLDDGYVFTFAIEDLLDVARFVANERLCCPFMTFTLEIPHSGEPMSLRITGPIGTRDVIDAELGMTSGCGCK